MFGRKMRNNLMFLFPGSEEERKEIYQAIVQKEKEVIKRNKKTGDHI